LKRCYRWSQEETDYIFEIAGTDHFLLLCRRFRRIASRKGWPYRSNDAIKTKFKHEKLSRVPSLGGWTCSGLAQLLGIRKLRVISWKTKGKLIASKVKGSKQYRIIESDFVTFAKNHPNSLYGIDKSTLAILLDNETIEKILSCSCPNKPIPVYSTKTGKIYSSLWQAEKGEFFSRRTIQFCLQKNSATSNGTSFIRLDKAA
jgi:hypothetical protein